MAFWDRVSAELVKAAAEGWEAVKAGTKVAAEKSEEVAKTGKLRYKSHTVHKKADKLFGQLGGIVYDMAEPPFENPLLRADVQKLIEDIKQVELEATAIDEEVERVRKSASSDASDVPYYYEAKSDLKGDGSADEDGGDHIEGDGENASEHACFSDCSGPCQCTDHTVVNSDLPEDEKDGAVESHDYKCPTDEEDAKESSSGECSRSEDAGEDADVSSEEGEEGEEGAESTGEGSSDEGSANESSANEGSSDEEPDEEPTEEPSGGGEDKEEKKD